MADSDDDLWSIHDDSDSEDEEEGHIPNAASAASLDSRNSLGTMGTTGTSSGACFLARHIAAIQRWNSDLSKEIVDERRIPHRRTVKPVPHSQRTESAKTPKNGNRQAVRIVELPLRGRGRGASRASSSSSSSKGAQSANLDGTETFVMSRAASSDIRTTRFSIAEVHGMDWNPSDGVDGLRRSSEIFFSKRCNGDEGSSDLSKRGWRSEGEACLVGPGGVLDLAALRTLESLAIHGQGSSDNRAKSFWMPGMEAMDSLAAQDRADSEAFQDASRIRSASAADSGALSRPRGISLEEKLAFQKALELLPESSQNTVIGHIVRQEQEISYLRSVIQAYEGSRMHDASRSPRDSA